MSVVYLLHFSEPIAPGRHTTQHYLGTAEDLDARVAQHLAGTGARLCAVAKERGITFTVARVWDGGRELERQLKDRKEGPRLCPICQRRHPDGDLAVCMPFSLADVAELEF